jgi:hypothetical protein
MLIGQEALELIDKIKIEFFGLPLSSRKTGAMQATLDLLTSAYRAAWQRNASGCARLLAVLHSKDHGAGDGFPQLLRVLGDAVDSYSRFAAAHPRPMLLLLLVVVGLFALSQGYKPEHPACGGRVGSTGTMGESRDETVTPATAGCTKHMWS